MPQCEPSSKRAHGQYYTLGNPFGLEVFEQWAAKADLPKKCILEPFAGANDIVKTLTALGLCNEFKSFDLSPADSDVEQRDTIADFPTGFDACITNPPWLARNSATRRGLAFPSERYDNLYKHCLQLCLANCAYVAALIPASFLHSKLFQDRLESYIILHDRIFADTENPVCLALFDKKPTSDVSIYYQDRKIGTLSSLMRNLPEHKQDRKVRFNDPAGQLGFIAFDNTKQPSIRFCLASEVARYPIKASSRFITRVSGQFADLPELIVRLNKALNLYRDNTEDVFLTPFKGMREDGKYRRRMDYAMARRFINAA